VALCGALVYRWRQRRARRGGSWPELDGDISWKLADKPQLHSDSVVIHEMDAAQQYKMPASEMPAEEAAARQHTQTDERMRSG